MNHTKKYTLLGAVVGIVLGTGTVAFAQVYPATTTNTTGTTSMSIMPNPMPLVTTNVVTTVTAPVAASALAPTVAEVDGSGNALVRGVVISTSPNSLTLHSWGGTWIITTNGASQVYGTTNSTTGNMSGIAAGDFVGATGVVDGTASWTVDASVVRDWTQNPASASPSADTTGVTSTDTSSASSAPMIPATSSMPTGDTLYTGTVTGVGAGSITFTDANGTTQTANIDPSTATIWNNASTGLPLGSIQTGDSIRIDGSLSSDGTTINADVLRDTSQ